MITGMFSFRALRPAVGLLSGQICILRRRLHRAPREGAPKGFEFAAKVLPGTAAGGQENGPLFHIVPRRREETISAPGFWTGLFLWQPETVSFWARPKRNGFGNFPTRNGFSCGPFLFWKKETVRTPKKKAPAFAASAFLIPRPISNPNAEDGSQRVSITLWEPCSRQHDGITNKVYCPYPAPQNSSLFRERGRTAGVCRVESATAGRTREQGVTKVETPATMLPPY